MIVSRLAVMSEPFGRIKSAVKEFAFVPSPYYSKKDEKLVVDEKVRQSQEAVINDKKIIDLLDDVVGKYGFTLLRNEKIKILKYKSGDHFDVLHTDSGNDWTFLICVESAKKGGEIKLQKKPDNDKDFEIVKQGERDLLIFPKKQQHCALVIEEGEKWTIKGSCKKKESRDALKMPPEELIMPPPPKEPIKDGGFDSGIEDDTCGGDGSDVSEPDLGLGMFE